MRKQRILMLVQESHVPPTSIEGLSDAQVRVFKADYDVAAGFEEIGHDIRILGVHDVLDPIRAEVRSWKPHVVFNLLEEFANEPAFVPHVLGYLELLRQPYTGCNPVGFMFSNDKARQRRILRHHRIASPDFFVARRGRTVKRPKSFTFPLIVKSLTSHGSTGISQSSVVRDDATMVERIAYVHDSLATDSIVEEFVEGRELYVGVLGNNRLETFPPWELRLENLPEGAPFLATEKVKWDRKYQKSAGVHTGLAKDLSDETKARFARIARRAYRALEQSGYARMDFRMNKDGRIFLIESNPNPDLSFGEDFSESAEHAGIAYPALLQRIVNLGRRWARRHV